MLQPSFALQEDELLAVEFVLVELSRRLLETTRGHDSPEERGELVVVVLRPAVERMVVTLRRTATGSEEDLRYRLRSAYGSRRDRYRFAGGF